MAYPHLTGDLDAQPELLDRLEALAAGKHTTFNVVSGFRSYSEQKAIWDTRVQRGLIPGVTVATPGYSKHQTGEAADVTINGVAIQNVYGRSELEAAGLAPLAGDAPHVELPGARGPQGDPSADRSTVGKVWDAVTDTAGDAAGALTGAAADAAGGAAKAAVGALWGAVGQDGARVLLYALLVFGGAALAVVGLARATGIGQQVKTAAATGLELGTAAATKGAL